MGWGPKGARHPEEKEPKTECYLESPKVETREEKDEIVLAHSSAEGPQVMWMEGLARGKPGSLPVGG